MSFRPGLRPHELAQARAVIAERRREAGREPSSLRILSTSGERTQRTRGEPLGELLRAYAELGVYRVMALLPGIEAGDEPLPGVGREARVTGAELVKEGAEELAVTQL